MTSKRERLYHIGKRLFQVFLWTILLITLISVIGWHLLRSDHQYVIGKIEAFALEKWDANLQLKGYRLEWIKSYPLIQFQLTGLSIASARSPKHPAIKINRASSKFNPWDLYTGTFKAYPLYLDSAWVHIYEDSLQQSNLDFRKENERIANQNFNFHPQDLPAVEIKYLDFHRQDNYRHKWQWAKFSNARIQTYRNEQQEWSMQMLGDCFFEGLVFKESAGGFLMNTAAKLEVHLSLAEGGRTIKLNRSSLLVDQQEYLIQGQFQHGAPKRIHLQIDNEGVTLAEVSPLLSDKIKLALRDIQVDQPISSHFSLDNVIIPGRKPAIQVEFASEGARVQYRDVVMTSTDLKGTFSNDCDQDGIGDPATSCIKFDQLDGDIFDVLPSKLNGLIYNLKDPDIDAFGTMDIDLPRLNALLAPKGKATFAAGRAEASFQYHGQLLDILESPFDDRSIRLKGNASFEEMALETANEQVNSPILSGQLSFDENQTLLEDLSLEWMGSHLQLRGRLGNLPEFLFYDDPTLNSDLALHVDRLDLSELINTKTSSLETAQSKKADLLLLEQLSQRLANNLNGQIRLKIDTLIYDTLFLTDLSTQVRLFSLRHPEFADSSMIRMDQLSAQFMGNTPVYANLGLSRDQRPNLFMQVNLPNVVCPANLFLPKPLKITSGAAEMLLNAHIPLRSLLQSDPWLPDIRFKGVLDFDQIELEGYNLFKSVSKISGPLAFDTQQLSFKDLSFDYNGAPFLLNGQIDHRIKLGEEVQETALVDLQLQGSHLDLRDHKAKGSTHQNTFSPPILFRSLDTLFQHANGQWSLLLDSVLLNKHTIRPLQLHAQLIPDKHNPLNHQLLMDSIRLGFGPGNEVYGHALLTNPDQPTIAGHFKARMKFDQLGKLLPSKYVALEDGYFKLDFDYESPLYDTLNAKNYLLKAKIDGKAELINGKILYTYRDFIFEDIFGRLSFDQSALHIHDLKLAVNGNQLVARGQSSNFFPFFILPNRQVRIILDVASPRFDFGGFTAPDGLARDTINPSMAQHNRAISDSSAIAESEPILSSLQQTAGYIDQLLNRGSLDMTTTVDEVVYEKFRAHHIEGSILLKPDTVQLSKLQMKVAKGAFTLDGLISDIVRHQPKIELDMELEKNDVREIFRQFENFGQNALEYTNLEGLASANITFKADINSNYSILPETMHGDMQIKLTGGQLIDLDALKEVSGFLSRKRRLDHILIDTLQLSSHIRGQDLYVDDFYLHSSSFDFSAMGIYGLADPGKTRVLFSVPIRNLFQRHISTAEMEKGNSKRGGINILIDARYKKDRMRFRWKPFAFGKKKYKLKE